MSQMPDLTASKEDMNRVKRLYRSGQNPNSLKNLKPAQPGEIRNPTGKNRNRPYTDAYEGVADAPLPESLRLQLNKQIRTDLRNQKFPDLFPAGITWAEASALRQHFNAVANGDTRSATEIREAVEGRATQRIEINETNDRLKQLIGEYEFARLNPSAKPESATPANSGSKT